MQMYNLLKGVDNSFVVYVSPKDYGFNSELSLHYIKDRLNIWCSKLRHQPIKQ